MLKDIFEAQINKILFEINSSANGSRLFFSFLPNYRNRHAMVYNLYPPLPHHNFYLDYASLEDDINEFDFVKQAIL